MLSANANHSVLKQISPYDYRKFSSKKPQFTYKFLDLTNYNSWVLFLEIQLFISESRFKKLKFKKLLSKPKELFWTITCTFEHLWLLMPHASHIFFCWNSSINDRLPPMIIRMFFANSLFET